MTVHPLSYARLHYAKLVSSHYILMMGICGHCIYGNIRFHHWANLVSTTSLLPVYLLVLSFHSCYCMVGFACFQRNHMETIQVQVRLNTFWGCNNLKWEINNFLSFFQYLNSVTRWTFLYKYINLIFVHFKQI